MNIKINMNMIFIIMFNALLIAAVMYVVGYLDWSAWWLLMLIFISGYKDDKDD